MKVKSMTMVSYWITQAVRIKIKKKMEGVRGDWESKRWLKELES
jgi:hypothetical protein